MNHFKFIIGIPITIRQCLLSVLRPWWDVYICHNVYYSCKSWNYTDKDACHLLKIHSWYWELYIDAILPKGPHCHAYAWQIGPFWQDTLDICCSIGCFNMQMQLVVINASNIPRSKLKNMLDAFHVSNLENSWDCTQKLIRDSLFSFLIQTTHLICPYSSFHSCPDNQSWISETITQMLRIDHLKCSSKIATSRRLVLRCCPS